MRTGRTQFQWLRWWSRRVVAAAGSLVAALFIWWGAVAVADLPVPINPVAPVQAESRTMSLTIHPGLPPITLITREPWELTPADLTAERVWYNLLTKPGFRWLAIDVLLGLLLVILAWRGAWILVRWSQVPRTVQLPVTSVQNKPMPTRPGLVVEIAGTVKITTSGGIIYQAWESLTQSGERELALSWWKMPVIRIVSIN